MSKRLMENPVLWEQGESAQGTCPAVSVLSEEGGQHKACVSRPDWWHHPREDVLGRENPGFL